MEKLQAYCNWLIKQYPEAFDALLSGPKKIIAQKTFFAGNDKRIELLTFAMTRRGPVYTFPMRLLVESVEDFDIPNKDKIHREVVDRYGGTKKIWDEGKLDEGKISERELGSWLKQYGVPTD